MSFEYDNIAALFGSNLLVISNCTRYTVVTATIRSLGYPKTIIYTTLSVGIRLSINVHKTTSLSCMTAFTHHMHVCTAHQ